VAKYKALTRHLHEMREKKQEQLSIADLWADICSRDLHSGGKTPNQKRVSMNGESMRIPGGGGGEERL
jgi:hypothetical protein